MPELALDSLTSRLFHNQISAADLIVLSKVDLIDYAQHAEAQERKNEEMRSCKTLIGDEGR